MKKLGNFLAVACGLLFLAIQILFHSGAGLAGSALYLYRAVAYLSLGGLCYGGGILFGLYPHKREKAEKDAQVLLGSSSTALVLSLLARQYAPVSPEEAALFFGFAILSYALLFVGFGYHQGARDVAR